MFKDIPKVDLILEVNEIKDLLEEYKRDYILAIIRDVLEVFRKRIKTQKNFKFILEDIIEEVVNKVENVYSLKKVINCTGVVLHTNLGRSPISNRVLDHLKEVCNSYNNLEFNIASGKRGSRYTHLQKHLKYITGCEDSLVVNNNAAAVLLVLSSIVASKEVIVPRSQLVEIGGSFRIPNIMELSSAKLVEIGTTNCNHISDFENAINDETAMIMKVHRSNFFMDGFIKEVDTNTLSRLTKNYNIPFYEDLGSGALEEINGLTNEKEIISNLVNKVDILSFSGDKLFGGPQAGIIIGKKKYIDKMKKNQLTRALRVGKLTISALEASLVEYSRLNGKQDLINLYYLKRDYDSLNKITAHFVEYLEEFSIYSKIINGYSLVGGGTMPDVKIESPKLSIELGDKCEKVSKKLRRLNTPIIASINSSSLIIDLRCVDINDLDYLFLNVKDVVESIR